MLHLLNQTLLYSLEYSLDMYGNKTASFDLTCKCRYVQSTKVVFGDNNNQLNISGKIQIPVVTPKLKQGMIVKCDNQKYEIVLVKDWAGGNGKLFGQLIYVREFLDAGVNGEGLNYDFNTPLS